MHPNPHRNYQPPRAPSRITVILSAIAAVITVAALAVALTLELAR